VAQCSRLDGGLTDCRALTSVYPSARTGMMGTTYSAVVEDADRKWHLERARIIDAIERDMTLAERRLPHNRYWTELKGERFLQVSFVDKNFWKRDTGAKPDMHAAVEEQSGSDNEW
jgi:hypothetical protein